MKRKSFKSSARSRRQGGSKPRKTFPQLTGTVQMTREGFIFVLPEGGTADDEVFVKAAKTRGALNGDTVRVVVTRENFRARPGERRREGEVIEIVERSKRPFVGILHLVGAQAWAMRQSKSKPYDIEVDAQEALAMGAQHGMKVAAVVDRWDRRDPGPVGHVTDVLGMPGENETEMHAILAEFNLPYRFSPEVENAADAIPDTITETDLKGRKDFRNVLTFTIDPADAKDFDDALSFRALESGNFEVGVHIADVSWYVKPGSAVDREARERGTSVYLVDRTVPMLPEKLCNKLCSLRPHEDKLCFSVVFELSPKAEVARRWFGRTVIDSDFRFDYEQAQGVIEKYCGVSAEGVDGRRALKTVASAETPSGNAADQPGGRGSAAALRTALEQAEPVEQALVTLHRLAQRLKEKRFRAGAINFDRPEMKVEVDEKGRPVNVYEKHSKEANWLIEEFMLLANRSVAEFVATGEKMNGVPDKNAKTFVYRVHDEPNSDKLEGLRLFAKGFGYKMGDKTQGRAAAGTLNALLDAAKGKPEFAAFEDIALRAMAKAFYSTDNIGHYGLAFPFYTHFTSPIRRYPDLMVHRLLSRYLAGKSSENKNFFEQECEHASERELVAADAERTSVKYKLVEYMQDKLGLEFEGTVSGVTEWGMYVQIEPTKIEGMVPLREMRSDFFEFDEARYRLVGRRTHRQYRLGDRVRIRVKSANLEQRLLDYELIEDE